MTVNQLIQELSKCNQDAEIGFAYYDSQINSERYEEVGGLSENYVTCKRFGKIGYVDIISTDDENESVIVIRNG